MSYSLEHLLTMTGTVMLGLNDDACLASGASELAPAAVGVVVRAAHGAAVTHHVTVNAVTREALQPARHRVLQTALSPYAPHLLARDVLCGGRYSIGLL